MSDTETAAPAVDSAAAPASLHVAAEAAPAAKIAAETPAPAPAGKFDALVDLWFAECIQNTPVGRYTDAYNATYAAVGELKRRLNQEN